MRTLNVSISYNEYKLYGIKKDCLTFADMMNVISRALAVQNLDKCVELAKQYGISEMTVEEIDEEIKVTRQYARPLPIPKSD
jgi:dsDNA-specific endonuclease/ATPase MutS2